MVQDWRVFRPTFVIRAPPPGDEAVAEVEVELMSHVVRSADRLDAVSEVEGRAEEHECHIVVRRGVIVVLVHFHVTDGADLGLISWSRQHMKPCHHTEMASADPPGHKTEIDCCCFLSTITIFLFFPFPSVHVPILNKR